MAIAGGRLSQVMARYLRTPTIAAARMSGDVSTAKNRCVVSMIAPTLAGGMICPKHRGQSGHPWPDPVTHTMPPITIRRYVIAEAAESRA